MTFPSPFLPWLSQSGNEGEGRKRKGKMGKQCSARFLVLAEIQEKSVGGGRKGKKDPLIATCWRKLLLRNPEK